MSIVKAIIMGLIQGLAEFLPISSSGHLAIAKEVLHLELDTGLLFDVLLHVGTLIAIFVAFWKDIQKLVIEGLCIVRDFFCNLVLLFANLGRSKEQKKPYRPMAATPYRRFVLLILVSTIPTGILGILLEEVIGAAGSGILVPGILLIATGCLLLLADRVPSGSCTEENTSYGKALLVGISQGIATLPGLSRSGTTITAGLLCGFERNFAVRYSFIMSIPAVLGAALLELLKLEPATLTASELLCYLVGALVAAVVGYISIKTMLVLVRGKKFVYFSVYCFFVGAIAIGAYILG